MKKHIVCGSAALLLTGLTAAMFSVAAARTHERAREPVATSSTRVASPLPASQIIDTVVVERGRYPVRVAACNGCLAGMRTPQ